MKKRLTAILAVIMLAIIGGIGGAVMAQGGDEQPPAPESPAPGHYERLADTLGLDPQVIEDAFTQAQDDLRHERTEERLQRAVEDGRITDEERAAILAWLDAEPEAARKLAPGIHDSGPLVGGKRLGDPLGRHGPPLRGRHHFGPGQEAAPLQTDLLERVAAGLGIDLDTLTSALRDSRRPPDLSARIDELLSKHVDQLLQRGVISQEQADAILEWAENRPAGVESIFPLDGRGSLRIGPGRLELELHGDAPGSGDHNLRRFEFRFGGPERTQPHFRSRDGAPFFGPERSFQPFDGRLNELFQNLRDRFDQYDFEGPPDADGSSGQQPSDEPSNAPADTL